MSVILLLAFKFVTVRYYTGSNYEIFELFPHYSKFYNNIFESLYLKNSIALILLFALYMRYSDTAHCIFFFFVYEVIKNNGRALICKMHVHCQSSYPIGCLDAKERVH